MSIGEFVLDPRLAADTRPVVTLPMCDVLLMDDTRYPWLVLVPRCSDKVEIVDLSNRQQVTLWQEVAHATAALRSVTSCEKINIGALGNIVRQLHVHVVARNQGDAAWPGPVWGHGKAERYESLESEALLGALRRALI